MIPAHNLPKKQDYPGHPTGYYTCNLVRYIGTPNGRRCCLANWAQYAPERNAQVWNDIRFVYPESEPVWLHLECKECHFGRLVNFRSALVVQQDLLTKIQQFKLDPGLHVFLCRFTAGGKEVPTTASFYGICGPSRRLENKSYRRTLDPENSFTLPVRDLYCFHFAYRTQPEIGEYDLFVGPQGSLFFSEKLVELLLSEDGDLQFDPVLFDE